MDRHLLPIAAGLAAILASSPSWSQATVSGAAPASDQIADTAPGTMPKPRRPAAPKRVAIPKPSIAAPAAQAAAASPVHPAPQGPATSGLLTALYPDLSSSVGIPKTIFVQRFVAESLSRFDRENRQSLTLEQLNQNVSAMEKTIREGALRWWSESDRTGAGRVGRDDAKAASIDQFRKLTGLSPDQTETRQQSGIREGFERGAAQQFARYDVDGDGFVTKPEVERRIGEEIERIERSARIARVLVEDGSHGRKGFLDRDKATLLLSGVFDALDADHDGTLGNDEIPNSVRRPGASAGAVAKPMKSGSAAKQVAAPPTILPSSTPTAIVHPKITVGTVSKATPKVASVGPATESAPALQAEGPVQAAPQPPASHKPVAKVRPPAPPKPTPRPPAARPAPEAELFAQPLPTVRDYPVRRPTQSRPAEAVAQ